MSPTAKKDVLYDLLRRTCVSAQLASVLFFNLQFSFGVDCYGMMSGLLDTRPRLYDEDTTNTYNWLYTLSCCKE